MKWEYKVQGIRNLGFEESGEFLDWKNTTEKYINFLGTEGWELVSVDGGIAYFKRSIKSLDQLEHYIEDVIKDEVAI